MPAISHRNRHISSNRLVNGRSACIGKQQAVAAFCADDSDRTLVETHKRITTYSSTFEFDHAVSEISAGIKKGEAGLNGVAIAGDPWIIDKLTQ